MTNGFLNRLAARNLGEAPPTRLSAMLTPESIPISLPTGLDTGSRAVGPLAHRFAPDQPGEMPSSHWSARQATAASVRQGPPSGMPERAENLGSNGSDRTEALPSQQVGPDEYPGSVLPNRVRATQPGDTIAAMQDEGNSRTDTVSTGQKNSEYASPSSGAVVDFTPAVEMKEGPRANRSGSPETLDVNPTADPYSRSYLPSKLPDHEDRNATIDVASTGEKKEEPRANQPVGPETLNVESAGDPHPGVQASPKRQDYEGLVENTNSSSRNPEITRSDPAGRRQTQQELSEFAAVTLELSAPNTGSHLPGKKGDVERTEEPRGRQHTITSSEFSTQAPEMDVHSSSPRARTAVNPSLRNFNSPQAQVAEAANLIIPEEQEISGVTAVDNRLSGKGSAHEVGTQQTLLARQHMAGKETTPPLNINQQYELSQKTLPATAATPRKNQAVAVEPEALSAPAESLARNSEPAYRPVTREAPAWVSGSRSGPQANAGMIVKHSEPPVVVHIGRIEVRAIMASPPPPPREARRGPRMSLEEYLKQRGGNGA